MTKNRDISKILDQNTTFTATVSVGSGTANVFANSTVVKVANSTVNTYIRVPTTTEYAGNYYLHANGTWQLVSAGATPGGSNTYVQFNDSTALGGSAGFTFDKATNNAVIANTLTVGTATINSTNYSQTANNATWHGTSVFANSTGAYPTSNSVGAVLGNTISRVIITGNSATFTSTLAAGDTTITGFVNATVSVNSAAHTIGSTLIANTLGVYHTGTINAASHTTTGFLANATHVVPTSNSSGQNFGNTISRWAIFANTIDVTTSITANGALGGATQILTSNSLGGVYWAAPSGGGNVTKVGTPADDQVGVWTGDGTIEGTAGFTFSAASNNAVIANTLTVGTATINSTNYSQTANNATWHGTSVFANSTGAYPTSNTVGNIFGNTLSRPVIVGNSAAFSTTLSVTTGITGPALTANTLGLYPTSNSVGQNLGNTTARWDIALIGQDANTTGIYPLSNTSGQKFGNTISRWEIWANTINVVGVTTLASQMSNSTGFYPTSNTVGQMLGNTTARWDIALVGQDVYSSGMFPLSNTSGQLLGNTISRFTLVANSVTVSGGVSPDSNTLGTALGTTTQRWVITGNSATFSSTLAATDTTITGFVNATASVNSAIIKTSGITMNVIGIYPTSNTSGQLLGNSIARWDILSTGGSANSTGTYPLSNTVGQKSGNTISRWEIFANTIDVTSSITANGALGNSTTFLGANSIGGVNWRVPTASASAGGSNTEVQFNDSTAIQGNVAFTFNKSTNTVAVVETGKYYAGNSTVNNTLNSVAIAINISPTANLTANSVLVQCANSTGTVNVTPTSVTINSVALTGTTGVLTVSGGGLWLATGNSTMSPLHYTSGTIETTPEAGDCAYDGVQFYSTIDTTSGTGAVPVEQYFHLTANGGTISTIANFFGTTSNPTLVASAYYIIDVHCFFRNTTAGTLVWTFTNSAAPTFQNIMCEMTANGGIVAPFAASTDLRGYFIMDATAARTTAATTNLSDATNHYHRFKIWLKNGTGTSLKIQATKAVGGTITPLLGSFWHCRRISPNNIGTFAA